jgi:hypothetical protein
MTDFLTTPLETITNFTKSYHNLFKDQRLRKGFDATITGILSSGTTKVSQIARVGQDAPCAPSFTCFWCAWRTLQTNILKYNSLALKPLKPIA